MRIVLMTHCPFHSLSHSCGFESKPCVFCSRPKFEHNATTRSGRFLISAYTNIILGLLVIPPLLVCSCSHYCYRCGTALIKVVKGTWCRTANGFKSTILGLQHEPQAASATQEQASGCKPVGKDIANLYLPCPYLSISTHCECVDFTP